MISTAYPLGIWDINLAPAVYQTGFGSTNVFKIAKRDAEPFMPISELHPVLRITLVLLSTTKLI